MNHGFYSHRIFRSLLTLVFVFGLMLSVHPATAADLININAASQEQLMELPGVGEVIAGRIIAYRDEQPFKSVDELVQVKGIGDKTLAKIRDRLTVGSSSDQ